MIITSVATTRVSLSFLGTSNCVITPFKQFASWTQAWCLCWGGNIQLRRNVARPFNRFCQYLRCEGQHIFLFFKWAGIFRTGKTSSGNLRRMKWAQCLSWKEIMTICRLAETEKTNPIKANCTLAKRSKEREKEKNRSRQLPVSRMKQNLFDFSCWKCWQGL